MATYIVCDGNAISRPGAATMLGHVEEQPLLNLQEMIPVAGEEIGKDLDVERRRAQTEEPDAYGLGIDQRVPGSGAGVMPSTTACSCSGVVS